MDQCYFFSLDSGRNTLPSLRNSTKVHRFHCLALLLFALLRSDDNAHFSVQR